MSLPRLFSSISSALISDAVKSFTIRRSSGSIAFRCFFMFLPSDIVFAFDHIRGTRTKAVLVTFLLNMPFLAFAGQNDQFPTNIPPAASFFKSIKWADLKKSQFESLGDYKMRLLTMSPSNQLVFLPADQFQAQLKFDAETQILSYGLPRELLKAYHQRESLSRFTIAKDTKQLMNTSEQNAFGAKVQVQNFHSQTYQINIINFKLLPKKMKGRVAYTEGVLFNIHLDKAAARKMIAGSQIELVFGVSIESLLDAGQYFTGANATFDSPVAGFEDVYELPVKLKQLLLWNRATHEILTNWTDLKQN